MVFESLTEIESALSSKASVKELIFYKYLSRDSLMDDQLGNSLEDQLCRAAFIDMAKGPTEALQRLRKMKPMKNMYYAHNLITLVAAALLDLEGEKINLEEYILKHSEKEQFIINRALGTSYQLKNCPGNIIEQLAFSVQNNQIESIKIYTQSSLDRIHDLIDLFILKSAVFSLVSYDREKANYDLFPKSVSLLEKLSVRLNWFLILLIFVPLIFGSTKLIVYTFQYTVTGSNWDVAEPYTFWLSLILAYALPIVFLVLYLLDIKIKPGFNFREFVLRIAYKVLFLDFIEVKKMVSINNPPEETEG